MDLMMTIPIAGYSLRVLEWNDRPRSWILWSDEAMFHLNGSCKSAQLKVLGRVEAPEITSEKTAVTVGVTLWCGMWVVMTLLVLFSSMAMSTARITVNFWRPTLSHLSTVSFEMVFQQDGASAHYANVVWNLLNCNLNGRWIGRRGSVEWPARSPHLTPLDFFF